MVEGKYQMSGHRLPECLLSFHQLLFLQVLLFRISSVNLLYFKEYQYVIGLQNARGGMRTGKSVLSDKTKSYAARLCLVF